MMTRTGQLRTRTLTNHEPSWWLRTQLDALPTRWEANGVRACPHIRCNPGRGPGITALHRPDTLTCPSCIDVFKLDGPADHECDRCGQQSDTLAGIVYDTWLAGMRLLVSFALCSTCETKELGR